VSAPTAEVDTLVKDALEKLYEPASLAEHPLASMLLPARLPAGISTSQALHQLLLDAVDKLRPDSRVADGALPARIYQILELRYVEALPYREVTRALGLSQAQYHRNLRQALRALATVLFELAQSQGQRSALGEPGSHSRAHEEGELSHSGDKLADLCEIVRDVNEMLRSIASDGKVRLHEQLPEGQVLVPGDRTALRHVIITLAGYVLGAATAGQLVLVCRDEGGIVTLRMSYRGQVTLERLQKSEALERMAVAQQTLKALGGLLVVDKGADGICLTVTLRSRRHLLLLIDDHPDEVWLIKRLIADQDYTVLSADNVSDGLAVARTSRPDLILLDIMMPEQDGWDALQALKHDPTTQEIPVLVCTVLPESQLALALGASEFIRKPLARPVLLEALARWSAA
jgi:CheY-like chemotaxis protein